MTLSPSDSRSSTAPPLTARDFFAICDAWREANRHLFSPPAPAPFLFAPPIVKVDLGERAFGVWAVHFGSIA